MVRFVGEYSPLLSMILREGKIKYLDLKERYIDGAKPQYVKRREDLFEQGIKQLIDLNVIFNIDGYVILRQEAIICKCEECGTYFVVIHIPESINKEHGKVLCCEISPVKDEEISCDALRWQGFCPKCTHQE